MMEFALVWFEPSQRWWALFDDGEVIGPFNSMGEAHIEVCRHTATGEADHDCLEDRGNFYRFIRNDVP